jgi:glycosyltransferase involved in cell wall biosynthesis
VTLPPDGRVALIHDWLTGYRGGEKVLHVLCELFPEAPLYTLIHVPGTTHPTIEQRRIHASWMNRLPGARTRYRWLLPLFPSWADGLDLSEYDLVVSSSHCVAKGARVRPEAVHVCYCHTPMRYVWDRFDDYFGHLPAPLRGLIRTQATRLRRWDASTAERVDHYLANSRFVAGRIRDFYGMEADRVEVRPPPVDLDAFPAPDGGPREDRYLVVSALVPYKRIDVAVEACARSGRRLTVAGSGPERERLESLARARGAADRIEFLGFVPDEELAPLMARHRAFLFPGVEDFGITPLEATACGLPVIARGEGGVLDTVVEGLNGTLYAGAGPEDLAAAITAFETGRRSWDAAAMRAHAASFSRDRFARGLAERLAWAVRRGPVRAGGG